jgi:hypothetical protein
MAEAQAGQGNAQNNEQQQGNEQQGQQQGGDTQTVDGQEQKPAAKERVYSQAEVDRIATKIRRNTARDTEISLRRQLNQTDNSQQQQREAEPPKPKVEEPPTQNDGESWEAFVERKAEYAGRKAAREEREVANREESERKAAEQRNAAEKTWKTKIDRAMKNIPDYEDVVESNQDIVELMGRTESMRRAIVEADLGPEIAHFLCAHGEEAKRIAALPAYRQAAALAKIEDDLAAALKKPDNKGGQDNDDQQGDDKGDGAGKADDLPQRRGDGTFKPAKKPAPDPIEPGSARSANANAAPSDKDDMKTWVAKREAEEAAKRRGRK